MKITSFNSGADYGEIFSFSRHIMSETDATDVDVVLPVALRLRQYYLARERVVGVLNRVLQQADGTNHLTDL